jgi:hypothetical protein
LVKVSPRGLFKLQSADDREGVAARVERHVADGEAWAKHVLDAAGINVEPSKAIDLAEKRPQVDAVHQALVVIHQARRLRTALSIARSKGSETGFQALWAADRMAQFLYAGTMGALVEIEPIIDSGRRSKLSGEDSGKKRRQWIESRNERIRRMVTAELKRGTPKMEAYARVARAERVGKTTIRNALKE